MSEQLPDISCFVQPPVPGSDHNTVLLRINKMTTHSSKNRQRKIWLYKKANFDEAKAILQCLSTESFPSDDVNTLWTQWLDFFTLTMSKTIPSKIIKHRHRLPYLTNNLMNAVKRKLKLFKQAKLLKSELAWSKYTSARNKTLAALRSAKSKFFKCLAGKLNSPRDFWSAYNKLSPSKNRTPAELKNNNSTATTSLEKADMLNSAFASFFTSPTASCSTPEEMSTPNCSLSDIECTQEEVHHLLSSCKPNTASGPDGISSQMIRGTATAISPTITKIFNRSLKQSRVPDLWKVSNVTPIPKDGDPTSPSNYRPISLLSLISKALERIVHKRISKFLYSNKLLSNCQFGFRPKSSTQEALLSVTNDWHKLLENDHQVATVFFDVKKAFDSVPHPQIISSLQAVGICGNLLHWTKDYLTNREQRVVLEGTMSDPVAVTSGVPQGSILGPLLFNIFMNSIANINLSTNAKLILYADDILLYKPINSTIETQDLQGDVNEINSWMQSHGLTANHSKTKLLTITRSTRTIPMNIDINNHRISPCDTVKYLGVTINNDLKWACHIHNTCKKAKQHLGFIHRKFHKSPPQIRNQIYRTAVLPKLDYCGAVWDPHHHTDIKKLESVQKFAGKIVTKQWRAEYPDLLASLNWKPLSSRRKNQKLKVCFNILNNLSIISPNVFTLHPRPSPRHPHNQIIFKPYVKTLAHRHSFFVSVIPIWNSLPLNVISSPSPSAFKLSLSKL